MTPEMIALLRQSQALISQITDLTSQLNTVTKAMFPPVEKRSRNYTPKELLANLNRRIKERDKGKK
jgi:hypothetical protein